MVSRFHWKSFLVLLLLSCCNGLGENTLVQGGLSPDGRYEVRIFKTGPDDDSGNPSNYYYAVVNARSEKIVQKLAEGGGFCVYEGAQNMSHVLWHNTGKFFALTDHGTRHSMEMYVYEVAPPKVILLTTQDYCQNALGRVGATEVYATTVVKPLRWNKDDLICNYTFDTRTKDGRGPTYEVEFTLHLQHEPNIASNLMFVDMKTPNSQD